MHNYVAPFVNDRAWALSNQLMTTIAIDTLRIGIG